MNYYISDLHLFCNSQVNNGGVNYDGRPFKSLDEMHECILRRWNEKVTNGDTVYILGDISMDCSGYVDWVFNNSLGYIIGHGGGAMMQHTYCTNITWADAQIGDLAFYPNDEHVGIVAGWDEEGNILIVHCASGYNNVVITDTDGFVSMIMYNKLRKLKTA